MKLMVESVVVAVAVTSSKVAKTVAFSIRVTFIFVVQAAGVTLKIGTVRMVGFESSRRLSTGLVIWFAGVSAVIRQES